MASRIIKHKKNEVMAAFRDFSVTKKLLLISMMSSAVALVLASIALIAYDFVIAREHMRQELSVLASVIGDRSTAALIFQDQELAAENLAASGARESIVSACIHGEDGELFATWEGRSLTGETFRSRASGAPVPHVRASGAPVSHLRASGAACPSEPPADGSRFADHSLLLAQPIELDGSRIGTISLRSHLKELDARLLRYGGITILVVLLATAVALVFLSGLQRIVSDPIRGLVGAATAVSDRQDYSIRAVKSGEDELGVLVDAFNGMLGTIEGQNHDLVAAKERLEGVVRELGEKNEELERFVYTVSHDLKSPLITIRGFLGLLEKDARAGEVERMEKDMERIHSAAGKMARLLNELLELSRIGRLKNAPQTAPVSELAAEAIEMVAGSLAERGAQVEVEPDMPPVCGDRQRLQEMFQNLVENGVKFMGDQVAPRIEIGTDPERAGEGEMAYFIRDNGIGIDPRYHDKVFGLFERLETGTAGTGIGLAIVKRVVEVHGGHIWVESAGEGRGTTFYFTLPLAATVPGCASVRSVTSSTSPA